MTSTTEVVIAALFLNARLAILLRITLIKMGQSEPATKIRLINNNTADSFVKSTIKQNETKQNKSSGNAI